MDLSPENIVCLSGWWMFVVVAMKQALMSVCIHSGVNHWCSDVLLLMYCAIDLQVDFIFIFIVTFYQMIKIYLHSNLKCLQMTNSMYFE